MCTLTQTTTNKDSTEMERNEKFEAAMSRMKDLLDGMRGKDGAIGHYMLICRSEEGTKVTSTAVGASGKAIVQMMSEFMVQFAKLAALATVMAIDDSEEFSSALTALLENREKTDELKADHGLS